MTAPEPATGPGPRRPASAPVAAPSAAPVAGPPVAGRVLAAALRAAELGWAVFPVGAFKAPWIRAAHPAGHPCEGGCGRDGHGWRDGSTDPGRICGWWDRWPAIPAYGIPTGPARLAVIDLDTGKGAPPPVVLPDQEPGEPTPAGVVDGAGVLAWAAARDQVPYADLLDTFTVVTPSGGRHLYYTAPDLGPDPADGPDGGLLVRSSVGYSAGRITGLGWCIDVRAAGGYVLGPGSHTRTGTGWGVYRVLPGPARPAPLPGMLAARLAAIGVPAGTATHGQSAVVGGGGVVPVGFGAGTGHAPRRGGAGGAGAPPAGAGSRFWAAAVAGELAHIAAAVAHDQAGSGRNATVNRAAYKLARLIGPLQLGDGDVDHVTGQLLAAAVATGLSEREARTAIASGIAQGRTRPRVLTAPTARPSGGTTAAGATSRATSWSGPRRPGRGRPAGNTSAGRRPAGRRPRDGP